MNRTGAAAGLALAAALVATGCTAGRPPRPAVESFDGWVYQLQGYPDGTLDALARAPQRLAVIDLARDAATDWFRADEIAALRASGKRVLAYFEIGSIERFRPEYATVRDQAADLVGNQWTDWPDEYFVRYWDQRWWDLVVRPRIDRALAAGFDGVYLDTPLAYEEIDPAVASGADRDTLAQEMVGLITRISRYAKSQALQSAGTQVPAGQNVAGPAPAGGFLVVPQNSPELRAYPGYTEAIDGIGMEELFVRATDQPCAEDYCAENLANARALRDAGKFVLAVDYATRADTIRTACAGYRAERFAGYVGVRDLDRVSAVCP